MAKKSRKRQRQRVYSRKAKKPHLDPHQRHERAVLLKHIQKTNHWKRTIFQLMKDRALSPEAVRSALLEENYRKELSLESVLTSLHSLEKMGFIRQQGGAPAPVEPARDPGETPLYKWNEA